MPAPLTVYRASAGAGKTFRLVVEYIKLLMLRPDEYKHILAVTFTKKATQEMKMRILSQLYGLREGLSSSNDYLKKITEETHISEEEVRKNAKVALEMILNDFGNFRIETIDSFFQSVLRNMTRELDISTNMRVELNGGQIKDKAIDAMIDELEPSDHLFERVIRFAEEKMEEGNSWDVVKNMKEFGKNIFTNFYQCHADEYNEQLKKYPDLFNNYKSSLKAIISAAETDIVNAAMELKKLIEGRGWDISIFFRSNASGLGKLYDYIGNGDYMTTPATLFAYQQGADNWLTSNYKKKNGTPDEIGSVFMPALNDFIALQTKNAIIIKTCNEILKNLNNIELLGAIENAVNESNVSANRFLLSSTNHLLSKMIDDSDAPFIFEKIGSQISHLMIDEFQDTSTLQWANFKNLMQECMSKYDEEQARGTIGSMIVGDVKQSIYRWRDGDWKLLSNIQGEFSDQSDTQIVSLNTNYRSEANIINFNNAFFLRLKDIFNIQKAYDDVAQQTREGIGNNGEIEFIMLSKEAYKTRHKMICDQVNSLINEKNVKPKNIAVLGRNREILKELSKTFMDFYPDIKVISLESFQLNASSAVNAIICALKLLQKPEDKILLATLEKYSGTDAETCKKKISSINKATPLIDLVEEIFVKFKLEAMQNESAFISAFFDYIKDFTSKNTSTIRNFLKYWEEQICTQTIETESANGVQMMTIHKSKGLEFDNVIIADGAWNTEIKRNDIWIELNEPFNDIPFTIVKATKGLADTIFAGERDEEIEQFIMDNLNMLYVAFTRAGKNLYYYGITDKKYEDIADDANQDGTVSAKQEDTTVSENKKKGKKEENDERFPYKNISDVVEQCLDSMSVGMDSSFLAIKDESSDEFIGCKYHFGNFARSKDKKKSEDTGENKEKINVFSMPVTPQNISLHWNKPIGEFLQSNRSNEFISALPDSAEDTEEASIVNPSTTDTYISKGLLYHNVLSHINTVNDIDSVLMRLEMEGVISDRRQGEFIKNRILGNEQVKAWFAPEWTVYNECSILSSNIDNATHGIRPDRVITNGEETIVIDFKFGNHNDDYIKQVKTYKEHLEQIGLPNVKGFLWYVYKKQIVEI